MAYRHAAAILIGRCVRVLARMRKPGSGSAFPGLVVNKIAPRFLTRTLSSFDRGLVIVTGSAGKSTTTKMLTRILQAHELDVFTNESTANILQGLTSALLRQVKLSGAVRADIAVLEMDEAHAAKLAPQLRAHTVILTNVITDQIDRFHDSAMVAEMLKVAAGSAEHGVVLNSDDPSLVRVGTELTGAATQYRFGASPAVTKEHGAHLGYTPPERVQSRDIEIIGLDNRSATMRTPHGDETVRLPTRGLHFAIDAAAALTGALSVLGAEFDLPVAVEATSTTPTVFGRGEVTRVRGVDVEFVLVQNTASLAANVSLLSSDLDQVFIAIGSDVRDPAYLWPADLSGLTRVRYASGSKAHEIALQLLYYGVDVDTIEPDLGTALDAFLELPAPNHGLKTIIFSADSMRRTRDHLKLAS